MVEVKEWGRYCTCIPVIKRCTNVLKWLFWIYININGFGKISKWKKAQATRGQWKQMPDITGKTQSWQIYRCHVHPSVHTEWWTNTVYRVMDSFNINMSALIQTTSTVKHNTHYGPSATKYYEMYLYMFISTAQFWWCVIVYVMLFATVVILYVIKCSVSFNMFV